MGGFEDAQFSRWIGLREKHRQAKREKDYPGIIETGREIIALGKRTPGIGIMAALFEKDIAEAYSRLGDVPSTIAYYRAAVKSFEEHRATKRLHSPDDFLTDIERLKKKLERLEHKK